MKKNIILICITILLGVLVFNLNILYADNTPYPKDKPKAQLAPNEVCVYTAAGYFGYEKCWKRQAGEKFLVNVLPPEFVNTISSIRVGEEVGCLMFEHDNYGGDRFFCSRDMIDLSKEKYLPDWNDQIESIQIVPRDGTLDSPNKVCLYTAAGYLGKEICFELKPFQRHILVDKLPPDFRNTISSVRIGKEIKCYIFEDTSFAGERRYFTNYIVDLDKFGDWSENWNDRAKSLIILRANTNLDGVTLYEKGYGEGGHKQFFPLPENRESYSQKRTLLQAKWMKNIRAVDFFPRGEEFVLIDLYDANGNFLTLPPKANIDYYYKLEPINWNNRIEAIRVYSKPPPKIETATPKPGPQQDKVTGTSYITSLLAKQYPKLSGTWNSNIGLVYKINQNGNKISYQDPMMHKPVNGTVKGKTVTVSWKEGNNLKELRGTITSIKGENTATTISWPNGVIFNKVEKSPTATTAPSQSQQQDKVTGTNYITNLLAKQYPKLSGTWNSNIGLAYNINQDGNKISYQDPMMHKLVNGTVDGKTVTVSWLEGNAMKSIKGTITSVDNNGVAKRIEWQNKVIFNR